MYKIIPQDFSWGYSDEGVKDFIDGLIPTDKPLNKPFSDIAVSVDLLEDKSGKELKLIIADIFISKWESYKKGFSITIDSL